MPKKVVLKSFEKILLETGKITSSELNKTIEEHNATGKSIEEIIVEKNIITYDELKNIMEEHFNIKHVELCDIALENDLSKYVPEAFARKYNIVPVIVDDDRIIVAMSDPLNRYAIDDIKFATGYEVEPVIAPIEDIKTMIEKVYKHSNYKIELNPDIEIGNSIDSEILESAPAVRLVDSIMKQAVKNRASDIHIEPFDNYVRIRFRIDGQLREIMKATKQSFSSIITRIKIISNLDIAEKRIPQDGRIVIKVDGKNIDLRVSTIPTIFGEKAVLRLLNRENFLISKKELGFSEKDLLKMESMIHKPHGMILITGPTGSGKSTTLYSFINELNKMEKNIVTIEDPVEYIIEGINQINVNPKIGLTFASGLRSILRQDPDVIMIGEIRDEETAEIAVRASITGHLVLSTLHTNDSSSSLTRLIDMGVPPFMVSSALIGTVAQRLVRRICGNCKYIYKASAYEKELLGLDLDKDVELYKGRGCSDCDYTGYYSQIAVYEIMELKDEHKKALSGSISSDAIKNISIKSGMETLKENCKKLVLNGITTIDEMIQKILF